MSRKYLACFLILFFVMLAAISAQEVDIKSSVDYKVNKMKKVLHLTDSQSGVIWPIIKDYLTKRAAVLEEINGKGIIDHVTVKRTLKDLKEEEYQNLSKILSEEQLKKWINKENLMAALNPDSTESTIDDGPTLGANGANFKF